MHPDWSIWPFHGSPTLRVDPDRLPSHISRLREHVTRIMDPLADSTPHYKADAIATDRWHKIRSIPSHSDPSPLLPSTFRGCRAHQRGGRDGRQEGRIEEEGGDAVHQGRAPVQRRPHRALPQEGTFSIPVLFTSRSTKG